MQHPIQVSNLAEIQRRVALPVVHALLREGELDELLLRADAPDEEWPWPQPGSVWLWFSARGEVFTHRLIPDWEFREGDEATEDAEDIAADLYDSLRDWLCETQLSWGELRDGHYDIPPASG